MEKHDNETKRSNYILISRPDGMDYETYKLIKNQQKKALKQYKKGRKLN